jgi:hypothetical protein
MAQAIKTSPYSMCKRGLSVSWFAKRHYQAIAATIQSIGPNVISGSQREVIASDFADMLASDNANFQRDRFLRACVPGSNVRARS